MMKTSLTGLMAASKDLNVISNNLSNASTVGFKRSTAQFQELIPGEGANRPGIEPGRGALTVDVRRSNSQGSLTETSGSLDIAIEGGGYFAFGSAKSENGEGSMSFSRAGRLSMDAAGRLVDQAGNPLLGYKTLQGNMIGGDPQPLNVLAAVGNNPAAVAGLSIDSAGRIQVTTPNGKNIPVGTVAMADFRNDGGLRSTGGSKVVETVSSGAPRFGAPTKDGMGNIRQGALEAANVDITTELLGMVRAQQAYNGNARAMQTASDMLRSATETLIR